MGLGQEFRVRRQERGLTVSFIANDLRISEQYLAAIEDEDYELIGGHVYVTGFMRNYASYLGLDADALIQRYLAETVRQEVKLDFHEPEEDSLPTKVKVAIAAASIGLVFFVWLIFFVSGHNSHVTDYPGGSEPVVEMEQGQALESPVLEPPVLQPPVLQPNESKVREDVLSNPDLSALEAPDMSQENVPLGIPLPDQSGREVVVLELAPAEMDNIALGGDSTAIMASDEALDTQAIVEEEVIAPIKPVEVFIRAKRMTWLRLSDEDGRVLLSSIVDEGARYQLNDDIVYYVASRDAGALEIVRDGTVVGTVGRDNEIIARRRLTRSIFIDSPGR